MVPAVRTERRCIEAEKEIYTCAANRHGQTQCGTITESSVGEDNLLAAQSRSFSVDSFEVSSVCVCVFMTSVQLHS